MPYGAATGELELPNYNRTKTYMSSNSWFSQAGLAVETYLSDRFNNWLNTEWIDGTTGGINAITSTAVIALIPPVVPSIHSVFSQLLNLSLRYVFTANPACEYHEFALLYLLLRS